MTTADNTNPGLPFAPRSLAPALAAALLCVVFLPVSAAAHELPQERSVLVEVKSESVEAMVIYQEPPGRRVDFLKSRFDFDGDDRLTGAEAGMAGTTWIPHALQGLEFEIPGADATKQSPEIKFEQHHNGALSAAIYLKWEVDALEDEQTRRVRVRRSSEGGDFTTLLHFQTPPSLEFDATPDDQSGPKIGPYQLDPETSFEVEVRKD